MAAYTDASKIAAHLGLTLTAGQTTQAGVVAQAASDWIDQYLGRSWQGSSPVTDELHTMVKDRVYLNNKPVTAVSAVKTRAAAFVGFGWTTLASGQYELLDATNGVLLVQGWSASSDALVQVTYTHTATAAPAAVGLAATMIAASWLGPTLTAMAPGIEQISLGQNDINVKFAGHDAGAVAVPAEALTLLGGYRTVVVA